MTITRADVADLRPGDVVEITDDRWPEGTVLRGAAYFDDDELRVGHLALATHDGRLYLDRPRTTLTVVSRAPRPLYVNSDRAEPVHGDIVIDRDSDAWQFIGGSWLLRGGSGNGCQEIGDCAPLTLLWDGETGLPPAVTS